MSDAKIQRGDLVVPASPEYPRFMSEFGAEFSRAVVVSAGKVIVLIAEDPGANMARLEWRAGPQALRVVGKAQPNFLARCLARS